MLSMSMCCHQELRQVQKLTQEQKLTQKIKLRVRLLKALRGEKYDVAAHCPKCHRTLKTVEVIKGFNRDPEDTTTKCPHCGERFQAFLKRQDRAGSSIVNFLCPVQTQARLKELSQLPPYKIEAQDFTAYASAIYHFGNLVEAFRQCGVDYRLKETKVKDWRQKLLRYLGKASDAEIARVAQISVSTVRRLRRKQGIGRYYAS